MRKSLEASIAHSPAQGQVHYPAGSIVICNACAMPIYVLERPIGIGQKAGRGASAFKPVSLIDLEALATRPDVDAGLRTVIGRWTLDMRKAHIARLNEPKAGDPMACPCCHDAFVQVLSVERTETLDQAYVIELVTIPPIGQRALAIRGRRVGFN